MHPPWTTSEYEKLRIIAPAFAVMSASSPGDTIPEALIVFHNAGPTEI